MRFFQQLWSDRNSLDRAISFVVIGIVLVTISFGSYYYYDRYIFVGDQSPAELSLSELEQIVRDNPGELEPRLALAQHYFDIGNYSEAIGQAEQALNNYPEEDYAMFILGMSYLLQGNTNSGIPYLEDFADIRREADMAHIDMQLETALYFLGETYNRENRPDEAIEVLTEALEIDFTDADAMYQLGLAYALTDEHDKAVEQYHNATRFVPDFIEAYQGLIASYSALDDPGFVAYARGMEAFTLGDYATAKTHLEAAIEEHPDFALAYLGLGLTYEAFEEYQLALSVLQTGQELEPSNFMINNAIGRIHLIIGNDQSP